MIVNRYVFTPDNFVKMVLILLRIRANIPVIMMGETGCGKTLLIRKLSEMINNGSTKKLKILNIHAGISDKDIIKFLKKKVINQAIKFEEKENKIKEKFGEKSLFYSPRKLWVFFDEINICKSMGLISEIMCNHTYQGNPLPPNIVFIAACCPYRQEEKNIMKSVRINIKETHKELKNLNLKKIDIMEKYTNNNLVYNVNPLPHSLLNFVFNFGNLTEEDEKKYIYNMILEPIKETFSQNKNYIGKKLEDNGNFKSIHQLALEFYEFFFNYLSKKKEMDFNLIENRNIDNEKEDEEFYKKLNLMDLQFYSITLAVFTCYYLRISNNKEREELESELNKLIEKNNYSHKKNYKKFKELPEKEETYIIENIELEKGIIKNKALKEIIFSLFVAINTKVPIFIIGEPGCGKSLSVQLIIKQ